jgi:hypothetical protein
MDYPENDLQLQDIPMRYAKGLDRKELGYRNLYFTQHRTNFACYSSLINYLLFPFAVFVNGGFGPLRRVLPQAGHFGGISLNVVWQPGHL